MRPGKAWWKLALVAAVSAASAAAVTQVIARSGAPVAKRHALAQSERVVGAPGRTLGLSRVVIPPGVELALHHHEGTQVAYIRSGVLTYTVRRGGSVPVRRGASDESPRLLRRVRPGQTARIKAGSWIVEQPWVIHKGANRGDRKLVILLTNLLRTGAPPSTPDAE